MFQGNCFATELFMDLRHLKLTMEGESDIQKNHYPIIAGIKSQTNVFVVSDEKSLLLSQSQFKFLIIDTGPAIVAIPASYIDERNISSPLIALCLTRASSQDENEQRLQMIADSGMKVFPKHGSQFPLPAASSRLAEEIYLELLGLFMDEYDDEFADLLQRDWERRPLILLECAQEFILLLKRVKDECKTNYREAILLEEWRKLDASNVTLASIMKLKSLKDLIGLFSKIGYKINKIKVKEFYKQLQSFESTIISHKN